jgi:hypothetical protein
MDNAWTVAFWGVFVLLVIETLSLVIALLSWSSSDDKRYEYVRRWRDDLDEAFDHRHENIALHGKLKKAEHDRDRYKKRIDHLQHLLKG